MKVSKVTVTKLDSSKVLDQYFQLVKKLGEGTFGVVMAAIDKRDGTQWAIKKIVKSRKFKGMKKSWEREFQILSKVQHVNIIQLKEMYETEHFAYLILEYCDGANLAKQLKRRGKFNDFESSHIIYQVSTALSYLHRRRIVHRDVKLENILLRHDFNTSSKMSKISSSQSSTTGIDDTTEKLSLFIVKLADFGLSVELKKNEDVMLEYCGTPMYMAPEIISGKSYSRQCDVWSLGIIMFMMLTGEPVFKCNRDNNLVNEIQTFSIIKACEGLTISKGAIHCLKRLLHQDPGYRFSTSELLVNDWTCQSIHVINDTFRSTNVLELMKEFNSVSRLADIIDPFK